MTKFFKYLFSFLILSLFLSSCAVLFNKDYTSTRVESEIPNTIVQVIPDTPIYKTPVTLGVMRSRSNLEIRFKNDTIDSVFQIKSRIDPLVWGNIYTYGLGALIDLSHPRGRTYPAHIHLTPQGLVTYTKRQYRQRSWYHRDKGLFGIYFDWTIMNAQTSYDGANYLTTGAPVFSVGLGMNYYLSKKRSIDVAAGFAVGTLGLYGDRSNLRQEMHSFYYRSSFQYDWRDFKLSAGLSVLQQLVQNPSEAIEFDPAGSYVQVLNEVNPVGLGPCLGFEWHAGEFITLGTNYMTGLYSFNTRPHWAYRDVILAISLKLRIPFGATRTPDPRPRSFKISDLP
jgi:hypothetical protein